MATLIKKLKKWYYGAIEQSMPTPPHIKTIAQTLAKLNAEGNGTWIVLDGHYSLVKTLIKGKNDIDFISSGLGVVLKAFLNLNTAEVRTFVAKFLDDPERDNLYQ